MLKEISPLELGVEEWNAFCCACNKTNTVLFQYFIDDKPTDKFICLKCKERENESREK